MEFTIWVSYLYPTNSYSQLLFVSQKSHRTISVMLYRTLKLFLKIIHNRVHQKQDMDIDKTQFETLVVFNVLIQRCLDVN